MSQRPSRPAGARELGAGVKPSVEGTGAVWEVASAVAAWRPQRAGEEAAAFAREVVLRAAPGSPARARALLFAASKLAAFGEQVGLDRCAEVLLHPSVIERFILASAGTLSSPTRRTLRTNLRHLARAVAADQRPAPVALPRECAKAPYSEAEVAGYLALADAQSTPSGRMRAGAFVCLGAGAGLIGQELRHLRGSDVSWRSGGLLVVVGAPRARVVPVLARFHEPLSEAAAFAGSGYLLGGNAPHRRNLSAALARSLSGDSALPRLEAGRLRATWLSSCARLIGLKAFMDAAGVRCSQRLGDLAAQLPEVTEPDAVVVLGGAR